MPVKPDTDEYDSDCRLEPLDSHYSHLAEATVLVDLRKHPRFDTQLPAQAVAVGNARQARATITNLSRSGLRLEGDRQMLDTLFPGVNRPGEHTPTVLHVSFSVPGDSARIHPVKVQCRSVYIRQESGNNWQVGMAFSEIDTGHTELTGYLSGLEHAG